MIQGVEGEFPRQEAKAWSRARQVLAL